MRKAWFLRSFFALIPITIQGLLFEFVMIVVALTLGHKGFDALDANRSLANIYISAAIFSMMAFLSIGLYKSRPIGRPPK